MTDLEVQCWRQWEGEGGLDCGLLPWVMVSDEQSPQCTVQTECCRGGYIICWILLLFGIFDNPERTIIKYIPCPWGLALLVPRTSGQNPPLRAGECRLPQYCSGILCCWSSLLPNIRWQKTGAVSGDWPTGNTGHTNRVGDGWTRTFYLKSKVM